MKVYKIVFPGLCLGLCFVIMLLFMVNIFPQTTLYGVTEEKVKPKIQLETVMNGEYQSQYQNWFGEEFPLRSILVKGYDQMLYSAGGMVNNIQRGKDGYLHGKEDMQTYIAGQIDWNVLNSYGKNLRKISDEMKELNKPFFYIISPGKAEVYSETLPWNYQLAEKRADNKSALRKALVQILEENEIPYIDMTDLMLQIRKDGEETYTRTGFHWNQYAQSKAILSILELLRNRFDVNMPELVFSYAPTTNLFDETDYSKILNVFYSGVEDTYYAANPYYVENGVKIGGRKSLFAMSTSFSHSLMNMLSKSEMPFKSIWRTQYTQFQDKLYSEEGKTNWQSWIEGVSVEDMNLDEILYASDIIYFESHVDNIPQSHLEMAQRLAEYLTD